MSVKHEQKWIFTCDKCGKEVEMFTTQMPSDWYAILRGNSTTKVTVDERTYYNNFVPEKTIIRQYGYDAEGPVETLLCPDCAPENEAYELRKLVASLYSDYHDEWPDNEKEN